MSTSDKLWVFQSNRSLSSEEESDISIIISDFLQSWAAHGADLKSNFKIIKHRFIVICVDEALTRATGCSIDSLNQCIRQINSKYQLDLLNRLWVSFENNDGSIDALPLNSFKEKIKSTEITSETYIYNLSVSTPKEFNEKFKIPLKESWAKIYL